MGNMHAFSSPVNKTLYVLMPASPAQSLHLYSKEMEGHHWEDCLSPGLSC